MKNHPGIWKTAKIDVFKSTSRHIACGVIQPLVSSSFDTSPTRGLPVIPLNASEPPPLVLWKGRQTGALHLDRTLSQIELRCIAKLYEGLTQVVPFAGTAICRRTCSSWLRHSVQQTAMITSSKHACSQPHWHEVSRSKKGTKAAIVCDTLPLQH